MTVRPTLVAVVAVVAALLVVPPGNAAHSEAAHGGAAAVRSARVAAEHPAVVPVNDPTVEALPGFGVLLSDPPADTAPAVDAATVRSLVHADAATASGVEVRLRTMTQGVWDLPSPPFPAQPPPTTSVVWDVVLHDTPAPLNAPYGAPMGEVERARSLLTCESHVFVSTSKPAVLSSLQACS